MTRTARGWRRLVRHAAIALAAFVGLLCLPSAALAAAPMCDPSGASVLVPSPFVPAPLAEDGEIRQGEPCQSTEETERFEAGAPQDQRVSTAGFDVSPEALPFTETLASQPRRPELIRPNRDRRAPPPDPLLGRVYRPPR